VYRQFLLRDAYAHRRLCRGKISLCPSVTRWYSFETAKHTIKVFSPSGSQTILGFPHQTSWHYSDGDPPNGGVECKGVWKKSRLLTPYLALCAKWCKIQSQWPWMTHTAGFKFTPFFDAEYLRNSTRYWHSLNLVNGVILNDLEWLSKIFSDTKRRSVSATAELLITGGCDTIFCTHDPYNCLRNDL